MHEYEEKIRRLRFAGIFLSAVITSASIVFWLLNGDDASFIDCIYMVVITVSTVGYAEVIPVDTTSMRFLVMALVVSGTGGLLYFASLLTAIIIEGDLNTLLTRKRMQRAIDDLDDHVILCGIGATGKHTAKELYLSGRPFVIVDSKAEKVEALAEQLQAPLLWIIGDAADDGTLQQAGIERASVVVCALPTDRDNVFVTITARKLNPSVRIVSRVIDESAALRLQHAGADAVISPNMLGGRRLAFQCLSPEVSTFMDGMLVDEDQVMRVEQIDVPQGSRYVGQSIGETDIRSAYGVLVLGVREPVAERSHYTPGPEFELRDGMILIAFGEAGRIDALRRAMRS